MKTKVKALAVLFGICAVQAQAQELVTATFKLDVTLEEKSLAETTAECLRNDRCRQVLNGLAASVGIPPEAMEVARQVARIQRLATQGADRDTTRFDWNMPAGYQTCKLSVDVVSTVPNSGATASILDVAVHPNRVHIVTWSPRQNMGEGRSWVEANLMMVAVRDDVAGKYRANGRCHPTPDRVWVYRCRGSVGDRERTSCGSFRD